MVECSGRLVMIVIVVILKLLNLFSAILVFASNVVVIDAVRKKPVEDMPVGDKFWYAIVRIYTIVFCFLLILGEVPNRGPPFLRYIISYLKFFRSYLIKGCLLFYIGVLTRDATFMAELDSVAAKNKEKFGEKYSPEFSADAIKGFGYTVMCIGGVHVLFSLFHKLIMAKAGVEGSAADFDPTRSGVPAKKAEGEVTLAVDDN